MCLSPITIPNPTRRFVDGVSRYRLQVPCNCCKDCLKEQQDDWFVRAFFEYKRCKKAGGETWFPLLTYREEDLPQYHDEEENFHMPAFNREHLKAFRDKLRVLIARYFFNELVIKSDVPTKVKHMKEKIADPQNPGQFLKDEKGHYEYNEYDVTVYDWKKYGLENKQKLWDSAKSKANGIRYQASPEFGHEHGRPHFHVLLFVPFSLTGNVDKDVVLMFGTRENNYTDGFLQKAWQHGYVSYKSKKDGGHGPIIESEAGIQYSYKYQWKQDPWYEFYGITEYKKRLTTKVKNIEKDMKKYEKEPDSDMFKQLTQDFEQYSAKLKEFRNAEPRRSQSTYFGIDGLNYYADDKLDLTSDIKAKLEDAQSNGTYNIHKCLDGRIDLNKCGRTTKPNKPVFKFNMPKYYVRKIFYRQDEYDLWQKTPFALEVATMRYDLRQQRKTEKFAPYFGVYEYFHAHTEFYDMTPLFNKYGISNDKELFSIVQNLVAGRSAYALALYDTVYRGISPDTAWIDASQGLTDSEQYEFLRDNAIDFMLSQQSLDCAPAPKNQARKHTDPFFCKPHKDFVQIHCFNGFDRLMELIEEIEQVINTAQNEAWKLEQKRERDVAAQKVTFFNPYDPNSFIKLYSL